MAHERPLSPHLGIYKREWTMIYSILHRFTGIGLAGGLVLLIVWLLALASGAEYYDLCMAFLSHPVGRIIMMLISFGFFYHLLNGIRHLAWDLGYGYALDRARLTGHLVMGLAVVFTLLAWIIAYSLLA